jgi:hypothetical protein
MMFPAAAAAVACAAVAPPLEIIALPVTIGLTAEATFVFLAPVATFGLLASDTVEREAEAVVQFALDTGRIIDSFGSASLETEFKTALETTLAGDGTAEDAEMTAFASDAVCTGTGTGVSVRMGVSAAKESITSDRTRDGEVVIEIGTGPALRL